jgi:glycosyltransferase involved in cell wall biosynthesis
VACWSSTTGPQAGAEVARLAVNLGVGGAMRTGFRYAVARGYEVVVQVDADGQHDPAEVKRLIALLDDADLVIGARFAGRGDYKVGGPRKWAMKVLSMVMSKIADERLTDVTSGFKAAGPRAIALFARQYPAEYLGDTVEALVLASRAGLKITQVPVVMRERQGGTPSHGPWKAAVYLVRAGLALLLALVRRRPSLEGLDSA